MRTLRLLDHVASAASETTAKLSAATTRLLLTVKAAEQEGRGNIQVPCHPGSTSLPRSSPQSELSCPT